MPPQSIWTEQTAVKTYATDFLGRWKPSFLIQELTDLAAHHAAELGYDYESLLARDIIWVLSRLKVRFFAHPVTGQALTIQTWPKGIQQRLFFMRDFDLRDAGGAPAAAASFAWLLVNPRLRRILPPASLGGAIPDNGGRSAVDEPLDKLNPPAGLPEQFQAQVRYSTVDLLGHANSARYVDWVSDCFSFDEYRARALDWLQINYVNEALPGERLSIAAGPDPANPLVSFVTGLNLDTGLRAFEAALGWKAV